VVVAGSGRKPENYPPEEKEAGWRDVDSLADEIRGLGMRALAVTVDVGDEADVAELGKRVDAAFGRTDFVINNAAASVGPDRAPVVDLAPSAWDHVFRVNVRGAFLVSQCFARQMIRKGEGGAIVNISSIGSRTYPANMAAYSASKAAMNALGAVMAGELGPQGIRVNTVCPGSVATSRIAQKDGDPEIQRRIAAMIPLRRTGTGADIADAALFLCSEQGAWITGQMLNVDGGMVRS
jgi:NAD(P)-dependent dehydrogenase (short-subunit alcohol dehydrogenase family)